MTSYHRLHAAALMLFFAAALVPAADAARTPNVIIIFTDDQGYQDLGCFGADDIRTPNIDRMAAEGRRFTSFYVASPVCSPSRAALLTGCYPRRLEMHDHVVFPPQKHGLNPSEMTIAELLKGAGYVTGMVGKWHLGHTPDLLPIQQGFDSFYGCPYSNDMTMSPHLKLADNIVFRQGVTRETYLKSRIPGVLMDGDQVIEYPADQSQYTRRYTEKAVTFIETNQDKPFFLYLAHSMPHLPIAASQNFAGKSPRGPYGDVIEEIDWSTGQVLDTLRRLKLDQNTIVIYSSDNGPWVTAGNTEKGKATVGSADPLRGYKGNTWEGGQRVPTIMWAPGRIPSGSVCDQLIGSIDVLPSLAALVGATVPAERKIDGVNQLPMITGPASTASNRDTFIFYSSHGILEGIRMGDWKLLIHDPGALKSSFRRGEAAKAAAVPKIELFNLAADVSEAHNLADANPERVQAMTEAMNRLHQDIADTMRPRFISP